MTEINENIESNDENKENEVDESHIKKLCRPTHFEPIVSNRFIAELGGIDSYLVRSVNIKRKNKENIKQKYEKTKLTAELYVAAGEAGAGLFLKLNNLFNNNPFNCPNKNNTYKIKLVNEFGCVISTMELVYAMPLSYEFNFDYVTISLEIECDSIKFIF
jgi:hypothetical protein